jgi:hypothetical protein
VGLGARCQAADRRSGAGSGSSLRRSFAIDLEPRSYGCPVVTPSSVATVFSQRPGPAPTETCPRAVTGPGPLTSPWRARVVVDIVAIVILVSLVVMVAVTMFRRQRLPPFASPRARPSDAFASASPSGTPSRTAACTNTRARSHTEETPRRPPHAHASAAHKAGTRRAPRALRVSQLASVRRSPQHSNRRLPVHVAPCQRRAALMQACASRPRRSQLCSRHGPSL